jgi:hypothetical protein
MLQRAAKYRTKQKSKLHSILSLVLSLCFEPTST